MKCAWVQERLLLYLAEELDPAESARIAAHLEGCSDCGVMLEELAESRDTLREALRTTVQPPASLNARILKQVRSLPRHRFPWIARMCKWDPRTVCVVAGCALVLVMAGYQWGRSSALSAPIPGMPKAVAAHPKLELAALADSHRAWDERFESARIDDRDQARVAAHLTRQTGLHITPPDLKDRALRLKDSAVVRMNHIPVAMLHYDWDGVAVSLAQADGNRLAAPSSLREMRDHGHCFLIHQSKGLTYIFWCEGTDNFILMARVPPSQLLALACRMCADLRHS